MTEHTKQNADEDPRKFWEQLYAGASPIWSGRVNRTLAEAVAEFSPGRSLDLGCGEGGDVLWLAEGGWHATGIDLSETAVARAQAAAHERRRAAGSGDQVGSATFIAADLAQWVETGAEVDGNPGLFDLITASFLQSPVELPRERILRAALARLAPGGRLVVTSHAAPPPWVEARDFVHGHEGGHDHGDQQSDQHDDQHDGDHGHGAGGPKFFGPDEELEMLGLVRLDARREAEAEAEAEAADSGADRAADAEYSVSVAEVRKREVSDPEGRPALIDDSLVVVRRTGGASELH